MKKSKFSEEQIVRILKKVEAGAKVGETCRKHGIIEPTYYLWKNTAKRDHQKGPKGTTAKRDGGN
ncbi:transposase-like protein [Rhodanobacter sp. ANJX3]|uniref:transposase n=1 Tax=Rhodanobacter sp. ANJX3 TaxID=2723083 RepID=UPI001615F861|nr:transposase [Rhodanobacter sp. ANJX3]MBB5358088.1 transposase-like protein [Rhodanobacter sp. ANJX3]